MIDIHTTSEELREACEQMRIRLKEYEAKMLRMAKTITRLERSNRSRSEEIETLREGVLIALRQRQRRPTMTNW